MLFCLLVDVNCFKKYVQLFPKAVNTVIEHFRGEGTLRGAAQPPCSRQGQLGGSGWITQGFGFESKPLRMGQAAPMLDSPGHGLKAFPSILLGPLLF